MNRFLKPVLAGATLLTLAVPALASAESYDGPTYAARGEYSHTYGGGDAYRGDHERSDFVRRERHSRWDRNAGYRHSWRTHFRRHHHWGESRFGGGWR